MGKPVEIEFLMKDRLTSGMDSAGKKADWMGEQAAYATHKFDGLGGALDNVERRGSALGKTFGAFLSGAAVAGFVKQMFQVRSQMQDTESSMKVFLGDTEKAAKFTKELKDYAWFNMFEFADLAKESASLLAFGNDVETVIPILDKLSNVATATGRPLSEIVELYNKAKSLGKVDAHGLESWARQGVVIMDVLKEMGIYIDRSSVKFEHLEMVLDKVTGEGGRFHGQMAERMQNLSASWGQLQDDLTNMFDEIGRKTQGAMKGAIEVASDLIDNYEAIGKTLGVLIVTYGTYRASLIATRAYEKAQTNLQHNIELDELRKLIEVKQESANEDIQGAVASGRMSQAKADELIAVRAAIAAKLDELNTNNATAQSELAVASTTHKAALQKALSSKAMVTQREVELSLAKLGGDADQIEFANKALLEAQEERHIAVKARKATADQLAIANSKSAATATALETFQSKANTATTLAGATAKNIFSIAAAKASAAVKSLGKAFASNPIGMGLTALVAITSAVSFFSNKTKQAGEDVLGMARAGKKAEEQFSSESSKLKVLQEIVNNGNIAYDERKRALKELKDIIPAYNGELDEEGRLINSNTEAIKEYLVQLERLIRMKAIREELEEADQQKRQLEKQIPVLEKNLATAKANVPDVVYGGEAGITGMNNSLRDVRKAQNELDKTSKQLAATDRLIAELYGEMEKTMSDGNATPPAIKSFAEQLTDAKDKVTTLKTELADLLDGKGDEADFATAIENKKKDIEASEKRVNLLLGIDKSTTKTEKEKNRQKVEAAERLRQIQDYRDKVADEIASAELDIAQAHIDAMEDGIEKERAQIALNYRKLVKENEDRRDDMLKELQKAEKLQWENDNPEYKDKGLVFESKLTIADLSDEQKRVIQEYTDSANAYRAKADADLLKTTLKNFESYEQQRARIAKEYDDQIALMTAQNEDGKYDENIKKATQEKDKAIAELDATLQASSDFWGQLFDNFSDYTNRELQQIISNAQELLGYLNSTPDANIEAKFGLTAEQLRNLKGNAADLAAVYDALGQKIEKLGKRNPFGAMVRSALMLRKNTNDIKAAEEALAKAQETGDKTSIKNGKEYLQSLKRQEQLLKGDIQQAAQAAAGYLSDIGSSLQQIGAAAGDANLESVGKAISDISNIAMQAASGDYIGAAISAITTGLTAIFESRAKYRAALKQMEDDQIAFAHEYKMAMSDMRLEAEDASNVFGDDLFGKAIAALNELKANYDEFIERVNSNDKIQSDGSILEYMKELQLAAKGITTDLQNISIKTQHKTWFRSEKREYLKDLYPELFEGDNGFNVEAARVLLNTNNQLNDEAKRQVQEVIDLYDQWQEAEEQFKEYLSGTFGDIGSSLGDSIVTAFQNGTDAMEEWAGSFNNVLENLGKQLMQTIFFQEQFDRFEEDATALYEKYGDNPDQLGQKMQSLMGNFFGNMAGTVEQAEEWYRQWAEQAERQGFDLTGKSTDQQSGKAGAFTTMSQEQGTKLEGLFISLQMRAGNIDDKLDNVNMSLFAISDRLAGIEENTEKTVKRLDEVIAQVKQIIRDGLKMK